jgi:hypothetical protein
MRSPAAVRRRVVGWLQEIAAKGELSIGEDRRIARLLYGAQIVLQCHSREKEADLLRRIEELEEKLENGGLRVAR